MNIWTDEAGGIYSADKKRLLKAPDGKRYRIAEGCEDVVYGAFDGCDGLEILYLPYTLSEEIVDFVIDNMPTAVDHFCAWDRPYVDEVFDVNDDWVDEDTTETDERGVVYANEGRRLLRASRPELIGKAYRVPDGVLTICDGAFLFCADYVELSVPRDIRVIGDNIFGENSGKIVIRDEL